MNEYLSGNKKIIIPTSERKAFHVYHQYVLKLKVDRKGFKTSHHDYVEFKYGSYNHKDFGYTYPEGYQFPSHTIYFAGFSISKDRAKLKVNNIE